MAKTYTLPANIATYGSGPNYSLLAHGYLDSYGALENPGRIGRNGRYYIRVKLIFPGLTSTIKSRATSYSLRLNYSSGGSSLVRIRIYHGNTADGDVDSEDEYAGGGATYEVGMTSCNVWDVTGYNFLTSIKQSTTNAFILFPSAYPNRPYQLSSANAWVVLSSATLSITTDETDYTLTYNANGGSGAPGKQTGTGIGSYTFTISSTKPTRSYYTFLGWSLSSSATAASYSPGGKITLSASDILYAVWQGNTYSITYNANGGSGAPSKQSWTYSTSGTINLSSTKPTRNGYTFLGWSTSSTATSATYQAGGSFSLSNIGNKTLYAVWTPAKYTIVYDGNGATGGSTPNSVHTYNVAKSLTPNGYIRTNYEFVGWKDDAGNAYSNQQSVVNLTDVNGAVITLYAQWNLLGFVLSIGSYDTNVFASVAGDGVYPENTDCSVLATLKSDVGYDYAFVRWDSSDESLLPDSTNNPYDFNMPNGAIVLTPIGTRTPYPYTVVYNGNGATNGSMENSSFVYGTPQALRTNSFVRPKYEFKGWSTAPDGSVQYDDGEVVSNLTTAKNGVVTLYACWELETYTISYDANGGSGAPSSQIKQYGIDLTLSSTIPTKEGYTFRGWGVEKGGNAVYQAGGIYSDNADVVLYASWEINTYSVVYLANGGTGAPATQTKTWGIDLTITTARPTRRNYNFLGWGLSETGQVVYEPGDTYSQEADIVLYAIWQYDQMNFLNNYNAYIRSLRYGGMMAIRLQWLNPDGTVAFDITDDMISQGSLNVSYAFGSRRSATVTMDNWANVYDVNVDKIWFGQQVKLWLGMYDEDGVPHLVPNGVFYINDPSITENPGQKVSNLNLVDKWHWLNGTLGGKLEAIYRIALGADLYDGIKGLLMTNRGNGYPIDGVTPVFDRTISPDKIPCPYEYRSSDTGALSDVLSAIGTMLEASMGYDEVGRFCVENIQLDVDTTHRPVLWEFSEDEVVLVGMSTRALMSQLYNDIIVCGGVLGGAMAYGRATDTNPASPSCVQRIGYKTNRYIESKYYSNEQCQGLAEYYLSESVRLQYEKTFQCAPIYHLKPNNLVSVVSKKGNDKQYFLINSFTIPLAPTGEMTIQATSVSDMRL